MVCVLYLLSCLTDFLDGYLARRWQVSYLYNTCTYSF
ncbi:CDP-alcohol phosphatidyltransferase family protein [archaeon]|nr:MAG: CDP-alcohol phosphatidyltransferase family protein [archaeon]